MGKLAGVLMLSRYYISLLNYDLMRAFQTTPAKNIRENIHHIQAAIKWLCRAQDAVSNDDGVSRSYSFVYNPYFGKKGWVASYPETTGYIIPTMFDYAKITGSTDIYDRAIRMADWECQVQLADGAVQGGTIDQEPSPAVFNTGQVIFGWLRAFRETQNEKYLTSAKRAGQFLVDLQGEDGAWRKKLSDYAGGSNMEFYAYNSRTAWALLALAELADTDDRFKIAGKRNIDFSLEQQQENGWFSSNCLNRPAEPLVHTIAYCIRGILEAGILLNNQEYINKAQKAADALAAAQRPDGSLAGRYDKDWRPTVEWSCLTGNAQTSIIWGKLYILSGEKKYLECVKKINSYLKRVQLLGLSNPDIYGGICGSHPIQGKYGQFEILNWAVKFFTDALLLEELINNSLTSAEYNGPQS